MGGSAAKVQFFLPRGMRSSGAILTMHEALRDTLSPTEKNISKNNEIRSQEGAVTPFRDTPHAPQTNQNGQLR